MFKRLLILVCVALFAATAPFALAVKKDSTKGKKVTVVVTHEVKEYALWRKAYDMDAPNRRAGGFHVAGVYTDVKNPNLVTIIGDFPNAAAVDSFLSSPKLKETMDKAGVIGQPDVKVLTPGAR